MDRVYGSALNLYGLLQGRAIDAALVSIHPGLEFGQFGFDAFCACLDHAFCFQCLNGAGNLPQGMGAGKAKVGIHSTRMEFEKFHLINKILDKRTPARAAGRFGKSDI